MFFFCFGFFCDDEVTLYLSNRHTLHRFFLHLGTVGLGSKDGVNVLRFLTKLFQSKLGGNLLTFLLGIALACSALYTFYNHLIGEYRTSVLVLFLFHLYEIELYTILLAPLYEFALEVDLLVSHLVDVDHL